MTDPEASDFYGYHDSHRLHTVTDTRGGKTLIYDWSPGGLFNSLTESEGHIITPPTGTTRWGAWRPSQRRTTTPSPCASTPAGFGR